ncbi:Transposase [Roseivivax sp. THAF30]|nr:Transposase [Roseivivax sp. THAF30]
MMKRSRFSEAQIIGILKEHQAGISALDLCRRHGISFITGDGSMAAWRPPKLMERYHPELDDFWDDLEKE